MTRSDYMLRIHQTSPTTGTTLALEGKLLAPWSNEVRVAAASALARGPVQLDLTALAYADAEGVATLRSLRRAGIRFVHTSAFIDSLLALPEREEPQ
ncbi:MAG: hypothetical protein ABI645_02420 [Pseudomonadota bacterium]